MGAALKSRLKGGLRAGDGGFSGARRAGAECYSGFAVFSWDAAETQSLRE